MNNLLEQLRDALPALLHPATPVGMSPTVYRNWCLGRHIHTALQNTPDAVEEGFWPALNHVLEPTPIKGQAALLLRFYTWFPTLDDLRPGLSWAHFQVLLGLYDQQVRDFYRRCTLAGHWTAAQLRRQVQTHWHLRRTPGNSAPGVLPSQRPHWLPDPLVLEFAPQDEFADEAALEQAIIDHLGVFLLELGQSLSFVARQLRLTTFSGMQMVIDLVFYQHQAHHFVLFELKNAPLTSAAVGQLQTYLAAFDDCWKNPSEAPSLGVLLCTETDPALQRYSALHQNQRLFAVSFAHISPPP